ncbi:two-component regulator propeller domain-containing protein [Treponema sp.]|uniref:two-component regulator propeller domain-containing protein n=1 Tax=Treponema sp. TaxID=166 RepID=UPI0025E1E148|nr:two-component regulator propeller domain-containing protein [Treponema sp.]MBR4321733.1 HD domain-containing protein [Treponema sp.]
MRKHFFLISTLIACTSLFALDIEKIGLNPSFAENYVPKTWTTEDGLPGMTVNAVIQDQKGYIYAATYDGLVRYDGIEFEVFSRAYNAKYDFASAHALLIDSRGYIWVGHNDEGISCFLPDGNIKKFTKENGLINNKVNAICEDKNGNIWIGTAVGISCITATFEAVTPAFLKSLENENIVVSSISCDSKGKIWIATNHVNNLFEINPEQTKIQRFKGIKSIEDEEIFSVCEDKEGGLWFCTSKNYAILIKDGQEKVFDVSHDHKKNSQVLKVIQDSQNNYWFATQAGITILADGKYSYIDKRNGLNDDGVVDLIEDREGNIWVALNRGGLQKLTLSKFHTINMNLTVNSICTDTMRGLVWLGTDDGVYCWKNDEFIQNDLTKFTKGIRIRHVAFTSDNELLVSGFSYDIPQIIFSKDGKIKSYSVSDGIAGFRARVSIKSSWGDYYVGTAMGLSIIHADGSIRNLTKADGFANDYIMWLFEDSQNQIWVGTNGGGIFILKDEKILRTYTTDNGLAGNVIFKIGSQNGNIWIGTGTGLSKYDERTDSFKTINSTNGLGTDSVFQLLTDKTGTAWITTNKGILSVPMLDLEDVTFGKRSKFAVQVYGKSEGLFTSGVTSTSCSHIDAEGRIFFTLVDGFAIYDPRKLFKNQLPPNIEIQQYFIDNEVFEYHGQEIVIPPSAKRLSIKFTGLSFVAPDKVRFSQKLTGFDKTYSEWSNMRLASYTNLPPGKYEFRVMAQNNDGVRSQPSEPLYIKKNPYLWQTVWFWVILAISLLLLASFLIYAKFHAMQAKAKKDMEFTNAIIEAFANCIDGKDEYTNGHAHRVAKYTKMLAEQLGEKKEIVNKYYNIALLHDIGKIAVPDEILKKPAKLTDEEFAIMRSHPQKGYEILKDVKIQEDLAQGARFHHERFDGKGYPTGISGTSIPWVARIIAVADTFDAMSSTRPYRKKLPLDFIVEEIKRCSGSQFDPKVVDAFLALNNDGKFNDLDFS